MKGLITLAVTITALAAAQPALVTVGGMVYNSDGTGFTGRLTISNASLVCSDVPLPASSRDYSVLSGVVSPTIQLFPLADCMPGYSYTVLYQGRERSTVFWDIHASPTTTTIGIVQRQGPIAPSMQVRWSQIVNPPSFQTTLTWLGSSVAGTLDQILGSAAQYPASYFQTAITNAPTAWPSFAAVATTGNYPDLANKPTIPTVANTSNMLKGNGAGGAVAATANSDYAPVDSPAFTGTLAAPYIRSVQTVNQFATASLLGQQLGSLLEDGTANTGTDYTATASTYVASSFTATNSTTTGSLVLRAKTDGTITNPIQSFSCYLYTDNSGQPGSMIASGGAIKFGTLTTSYQQIELALVNAVVAGIKYWFVVKQSAVPAGANLIFDSTTGAGAGASSTDGTTWTTTSNAMYFKFSGRTYFGVYGISTNTTGVSGSSTTGVGVWGASFTYYGVYGISTNSTGVFGTSTNNTGVQGVSANFNGVQGTSTSYYGVQGVSTSNSGVYGVSTSLYGVYGSSNSSIGVLGNSLNGSGGTFQSSGALTQNNAANVMLIRRFPSGAYNVTGNLLQITDNPTVGGTISGYMISGQVDAGERIRFDPRVANSGTAVAYFVDTAGTLALAGAKLWSWKNAGVEKAYVGWDGSIVAGVAKLDPVNGVVVTGGPVATSGAGSWITVDRTGAPGFVAVRQDGSGGGRISSVAAGGLSFSDFVGTLSLGAYDTGGHWYLGKNSAPTTATLTLYDATAATGVTRNAIRAGAGQSTTNLQEWQNNAGTAMASVAASGSLTAPTFIPNSSAPGISGCSSATIVGNNHAGVITAGGVSCNAVLTFNYTAGTGWACQVNNRTLQTRIVEQASDTATTATFAGTTVAADKLSYVCMPY